MYINCATCMMRCVPDDFVYVVRRAGSRLFIPCTERCGTVGDWDREEGIFAMWACMRREDVETVRCPDDNPRRRNLGLK